MGIVRIDNPLQDVIEKRRTKSDADAEALNARHNHDHNQHKQISKRYPSNKY